MARSGVLVGFWKEIEFHSDNLFEEVLIKELPATVVRVKEINKGCGCCQTPVAVGSCYHLQG